VRPNRLVWLLFLVFAGLGWAGAHSLAYRVTASGHAEGSAYHDYLPTSLALCLALAICFAAAGRLAQRHGALPTGASVWLFGLAPLLGFLGHGQMGRELLAGSAGFLAQIAFALVALRVGRGALELARAVARVADQRRTGPLCQLGPSEPLAPTGVVRARLLPAIARPRGPPLASQA
jgi:hypothetical protein